jgi:hypothetical protein
MAIVGQRARSPADGDDGPPHRWCSWDTSRDQFGAAASGEALGQGLVLTGTGDAGGPLAAVLLHQMVTKFVQEYVKQHEPAQRIVRPRHTRVPSVQWLHMCACPLNALTFAGGQPAGEHPRGWLLVIEHHPRRYTQPPKNEPGARSMLGRRQQQYATQPICVPLAEQPQHRLDIRSSGGMDAAGAWADHPHAGQRRWPCAGTGLSR